MNKERPVWAEIDLNNIVHNYREVRRLVGEKVKVMAIVKANAYGHGALPVAHSLDGAGADCFGVAILNEAIQLRTGGVAKPILVLGWTPQEDYERALAHNVTLTIYSLEEAQVLGRISLEKKQTCVVHLKIDTGMGRLGLRPSPESLETVGKILSVPGIRVEGIFTHLARADELDKSFTQKQLAIFQEFVGQIEETYGYTFSIKHAANSAAIIDHPEAYFNLVRPGIMLYGLRPSDEVQLEKVDLHQAMALKARVSLVKEVAKGTPVSYGGRYVTDNKALIGSLPLGYADGFSRLLSGKAGIIYRGQRAPLVGRICMDQCMFLANGLEPPVQQGDVVTLMGHDGQEFISVDEIAEKLGTINYEVTCMLSGRVPRVYLPA